MLRIYDTVRNLFKQPVPDGRRQSFDQITEWSDSSRLGRNDFPQQLIQDVNDSPTAAAAIDIWEEFTSGNGFVSEELNKLVINKDGETLEELADECIADLVRFYGFAIHVSYNYSGGISELHHQPFEQTRLGLISKTGKVKDIKTNPYFGIYDTYETKFTKEYYTYNPDPAHVIQEIAGHNKDVSKKYEYPGQMFWFSIEKPLSRIYPVPFYYSGINWFRIDAEIQRFHERNLKNNMMLSHVINVYGDPDAPSGELDSEGNPISTVGEDFRRMLELKAQGAQMAGSQWVNWFMSEEQKISITAFPTNINDNTFTNLQGMTNSEIAIATNVPPILLNIQTAGKLGETKEIINAIKLMQGRVKRLQGIASKQFKKLINQMNPTTAGLDFTISDINLINILPEWANDVMTTSELRMYLQNQFPVELSIAEESKTPTSGGDQEIAGIKASQINQILSVTRKVAKGDLTREQGIQILISRFAMSEADAAVWIPEGETETETDTPTEGQVNGN